MALAIDAARWSRKEPGAAGWRRHWQVLFVAVLTGGLLTVPGGPASAQSCVAGTASDFNGDSVADVAIADPDATVGGVARAGRVHVVYGGGDGSQTFSQAESFVNGEPEPGDRFGFSMASVDWNGDGCSDLVVATPFEAMGDRAEAGQTQVLFGSPSGFGPNGHQLIWQDTAGVPGTAEAGDRFGFSLAAGVTAGAPFLVVGVPGEDVDDAGGASQVDTGAFHYIRGSTSLVIHQDSTDVWGELESGDLFGYAVAATARHVVVSGPGETVESAGYSGMVAVFSHNVAAGTIGGWHQGLPDDLGNPEPSDWCGRSLATADYIPPGGTAANAKSLVVIGCPGEALSAVKTAGRVVTLDAAAGSLTEIESIGEGVNVVDDAEVGDYFGWSVAAANRTPSSPVTWDKLLVVAGIPGEGLGGLVGNGAALAFSALGPPGDHDRWVDSGELSGSGWQAATDARFGQHLTASRTHLFVADPYGETPAVYAIPWQSVIDNSTAGVRVYKPGADGLPVTGVGAFGGAIA